MCIYDKLTDSDDLREILGEHPPLSSTVRHIPSGREYIMGFQSLAGTNHLTPEWVAEHMDERTQAADIIYGLVPMGRDIGLPTLYCPSEDVGTISSMSPGIVARRIADWLYDNYDMDNVEEEDSEW